MSWKGRIDDGSIITRISGDLSGRNLKVLVERVMAMKGRSKCHNIYHRWIVGLVMYFSRVCCINPLDSANRRGKSDEKSNGQSVLNLKLPLWTQLIRVFYLYSVIKIMVLFYLQHNYNFYNYHVNLKHKNARLAREGNNSNQSHPEVDPSLRHRLEEARLMVKSIGSPFIDLNFVIDCAYIFIIIFVFAVYPIPQLYFKYRVKFDFGYLRMMLDARQEQSGICDLIYDEVDRFVSSSRNFTYAAIESLVKHEAGSLVDLDQASSSCLVDQLILEHRLTCNQLKKLLLNDSLQPPNRCPDVIEHMSLVYIIISLSIMTFGHIFIATLMFLMPALGVFPPFETDPLDILLIYEFWLYLEIGLHGLAFYITTVVLSFLDQIGFTQSLLRDIGQCIKSTESAAALPLVTISPISSGDQEQPGESPESTAVMATQVDRFLQVPIEMDLLAKESKFRRRATKRLQNISPPMGPSQLSSSRSETLNMNLTHVFVKYKIFVAQLKPIQQMSGYFCFSAVSVLVSGPIIGRIYLAYLEPLQRWAVLIVSITCLAFGDIYLSLMCYLQCRLLDLYKGFWSLLAHSISFMEATMDDPNQIYSHHLISLLRKELNHPDLRCSATTTFGMSVTYRNLIRLHFWCGILLLSIILFDEAEDHKATGSIVNDPINIF